MSVGRDFIGGALLGSRKMPGSFGTPRHLVKRKTPPAIRLEAAGIFCLVLKIVNPHRLTTMATLLIGGLQHIDLMHHSVLTGGELIDGLRQRGDTLLAGGELPDAVPQCCETWTICCTCTGSRVRAVGAFGATVSGAVCVTGSALLSTTGFHQPICCIQPAITLLDLQRPAKLRDPCRDYLLCCMAVRLPSQDGGNNNASRDQITDSSPRG
jgi:hypothetical protein